MTEYHSEINLIFTRNANTQARKTFKRYVRNHFENPTKEKHNFKFKSLQPGQKVLRNC